MVPHRAEDRLGVGVQERLPLVGGVVLQPDVERVLEPVQKVVPREEPSGILAELADRQGQSLGREVVGERAHAGHE